MSAQELLGRKRRDYGRALDQHVRAVAAQQAAREHVLDLERRQDEDGRSEKTQAALAQARIELEQLTAAAERAGRLVDRKPQEHRGEWLRRARGDFEAARDRYERQLDLVAEARETLAREAELIQFLGGPVVVFPTSLRVHTAGIEGSFHDVRVSDVLEALRDELIDFELVALHGGHR